MDDGIRGKDYVLIKEGNILLNSGGDGLKADNDQEPEKGFVFIGSGAIEITSGGGSDIYIEESESAKGIKAAVNTIIENGIFIINSADDAIHSDCNLVMNGGSYDISSGDDGLHADANLLIDGGTLDLTESYEDIESMVITLNSGTVHISSDDDGINGTDGTSTGGMPGQFELPESNC